MTAQMKLTHVHHSSRSYSISQREAERLGLPALVSRPFVAPPRPPAPPNAKALQRQVDDIKRRRMILDIRRAEALGAGRSCRVIAMKVALRTGFFLKDLKRTCRERDLVAARHRAIYGARAGTSRSMKEIGRFYGLDHSTIHYSVREHARRSGRPVPLRKKRGKP